MLFLAIVPGVCIVVMGISNYICLWSQFPNSINKVTALAIVFGSLGTSLWGLALVHSINPNNAQAISNQNESDDGTSVSD